MNIEVIDAVPSTQLAVATVLETKALTLPEQARAIIITNQPTFEGACALTLAAKALRREITDYHRPLKQAADRAKQAILDAEKRMLSGPLETEAILDPAIARWQTEQRRIAEDARRAAALAAEEESRRQAAAAALLVQQAKQAEDDRRLAEAEALQEAGASEETVEAVLSQPSVVSHAEVAAIVREPVFVPAPPPIPTFEKVAGISTRDNWKFEITDILAIPREYLTVDEQKIGGVVRAMKASTNIPGIRVYNQPTTIGRTGGR